MGIDDNETFDKAFDAAEAKLAGIDVEKEVEPEVESEEAPTEEKTEEVVEEAVEPEKQVSDQKAESGNVEAEPVSEPEPSIEIPAFWPADLKAASVGAPKALIEAFKAHDARREEWARRNASESGRGKAIEEKANQVFEPYKLKLQANGIRDPFEAAERLLAWNEMFETDPRRAISDLMAKNGLTPEDFHNDGTPTQSQVNDPRVDQALARAEAAERAISDWKEEQKTSALTSEIESFKNGKDSQGQTRKAFAEMFAPQITQATEAFQRVNPNMALSEALSNAYEYVLSEQKKLFGVTAKPKPTQPNIELAKKAKAAASSTTGSPSTGVVPPRVKKKGDFKSQLDQAIDSAEDALESR